MVGAGGPRGHDDSVGLRTTVLLRRPAGASRRAFRSFVRERLAPALVAAGARDLRGYTFLPNLPHPQVAAAIADQDKTRPTATGTCRRTSATCPTM